MVEVTKISTYTGHKDCVYVLEKSGEESCFFSASGDGLVVRWDMNKPDQGEVIAKVENSVYAMTFVPVKNWLIIGQNFKGLHVIDLTTKKEIRNLHFTESAIFDIVLAEQKVFVACGNGKVHSFGLEDFSLRDVFNFSDKSARCLSYNFIFGHLAIGYSDNFIRILEGDKLLTEIPAHSNSVFTVAYSPDGTELISGSRDAHIKIWDVNGNYSLKTSIVAHMYAIHHIVFKPNGKFYASASMDKSIKIWDSETHKLLKVIDKSRHGGHATSVNKLQWTSNQEILISGSDDRNISLWDIRFS